MLCALSACLPFVLAVALAVDGTAAFVPQSELDAATPAADAEYGASVAVDGSVAVVGSPIDGGDLPFAGVAYVYAESSGVWVEEARLLPSDSASGDQFGRSVAVEGDFAFVSADNALAAGGFVNGAVYVFERQGGAWSEVARIEPADGAFGDGFGRSIAVSNGTLVVGAPGAGGSQGKAYVYVGAGASWTEEDQLVPAAAGQSGWVVDVDGDVALVTSPLFSGSRGAATVFTRSGSTWSEEDTLFDTDPAVGERFGSSGALCGRAGRMRAAVGSPALDGFVGGVVVFLRSGSTWGVEQKVGQSPPVFGSAFGVAVALEGDTLVVGGPDDDGPGASQQGAALVFARSGSSWNEVQVLGPVPSPDDGEQFGAALALSGERLVVGDVQGSMDEGEAAVFRRQALAGVVNRTAGANPASYVADPPVLGSAWSGTVDLSTTGDTAALLGMSLAPLDLLLPGGQTLLVSPAPPLFLLPGPPAAGSQVAFALPIPPAAALAGLVVYSQALQYGGGAGFSLSNAQDLCLGF
jgi:hypothetical protein